MRTLLTIATLTVITTTAVAQQALWGAPAIVSPEINKDNTVTFRLDAPNARRVLVTGDFLPTVKIRTPFGEADIPGNADLSRNSYGQWEFTTDSPLQSELYTYSFIVDSLKITDPANVYQLRDIASISNIFIVPGERGDLYSVNRVPHGTVSKVWYESPSLGLNRRLSIYTPPGYGQTDRRYPVLYLLHGMGGDENAWLELGRASQILDNMIARGEVEPMIVVMSNGNASEEAAPGDTSAGLKPPTTQLPKTMDGSFEAAFPEVISFVDSNYMTIPEKNARAIAGLSMGGFHSMQISKEYPDMFDYIGLFSAAILPREGIHSPVYEDFDSKLRKQFDAKPALYWIAIGNKDFLYDANREYRKKLDSNGYHYEYFESEDGHIWKNWRVYLSEFLPRLFKKH